MRRVVKLVRFLFGKREEESFLRVKKTSLTNENGWGC